MHLSQTLLTQGITDFKLLPYVVRYIDDCIDESDPDSTPGIPLNYYCSKKSVWCEDRLSLIHLIIDRLIVLLDYNSYGFPTQGSDLVNNGMCDPIYTFIKDEPHKREKLDKSRFRIISGVSLVDNIIERFLFSRLNKAEIEMNEDIPFKPGMGLHDDGQEALYSWFCKVQSEYPVCSTDVSQWDWSVFEELLDADLQYRRFFANDNPVWYKLAKARFLCIKYKVFQLPSGKMFSQVVGGILPSGSYLTSSTNSHMRLILSFIVQLRLGHEIGSEFAEGGQMGDDAIERYLEGLLDEYRDLGFTVKGVDLMSEGKFSFCSTYWDGNSKGFPESWAKTLFRFLHKKTTDPLYPEYRRQFIRDLRHHPNLDDLIARVDEFKSSF